MECLKVHTDTLGEALGNIGDQVGADRAEAERKRDTGGDPVRVVVAVDRDSMAAGDGLRDQVAGDRHVLQEEWIGRPIEVGLQPGIQLTLAGHAASMQDLPEYRGEGLQSWLSPTRLGEDPVPAVRLPSLPA